jgi:hypothetical protein
MSRVIKKINGSVWQPSSPPLPLFSILNKKKKKILLQNGQTLFHFLYHINNFLLLYKSFIFYITTITSYYYIFKNKTLIKNLCQTHPTYHCHGVTMLDKESLSHKKGVHGNWVHPASKYRYGHFPSNYLFSFLNISIKSFSPAPLGRRLRHLNNFYFHFTGDSSPV